MTCWESLFHRNVERGAGVGGWACKALEGSKDYQGCLCDILNQESDKGPAGTNENHLGRETLN